MDNFPEKIPGQDNILNRISGLSPEKRALLIKKLRVKIDNGNSIPHYPNLGQSPLSYAQERLWFLDKFYTGIPLYTIPVGVKINGRIDQKVLSDAINTVIERHEVLRAIFLIKDEDPVQIRLNKIEIPLNFQSLASLSVEDRFNEAMKLGREEASRPFNIESGPLVKTFLLELSPDENFLIVIMHHIVADARSLSIFVHETLTIYESLILGDKHPLDALKIQYSDFSIWQREMLQGQLLENQLDYWSNKICGLQPSSYLPADYHAVKNKINTGKHVEFSIPIDLGGRIRDLSQLNDATLYMVLLTAFQILLMRYSQEEDIAVGTPISTRNRPEFQELIGFFINTLVIRTDLSGDPTFQELLTRVKQNALDAYANQDIPFEFLVDTIYPIRESYQSPFFKVLFSVQSHPLQNIHTNDIDLHFIEIETGTVKFDLSFVLYEEGDKIVGHVGVNTELYEIATINRFWGNFLYLLDEIVSDPETTITRYKIITESEEKILLDQWSGSTRSFKNISTIPHLLFENIKSNPKNIAIVDLNKQKLDSFKSITYEELFLKVGRLVNFLTNKGLRANQVVGVLLDRSIEFVISLIGIHIAGGAFLPIDLSNPSERIKKTLITSSINYLVSTSTIYSKYKNDHLPDQNIINIEYVLEDECNLGIDENTWILNSNMDDLCYLIYTSGTTGDPKRVKISNSSLNNYIIAAIEKFKINNKDKVLQFSALGFDTSLEEIFCCLAGGATLILRNEDVVLSSQRFLSVCKEQGITILDLPTSFWNHLVKSMKESQQSFPECVRLVVIGGEKANRDTFMDWYQRGENQPEIINTYGPTEATIVSTWWTAPSKPDPKFYLLPHIPIGKPIPDVKIYVIDREMKLAPIGAIGELIIGGQGVSLGYLGADELTVEKFISNPFSFDRGNLYRTGDFVRWNNDGELEYIGRLDRQVKIRTYRVELEEIELAITKIDGINDSVVLFLNREHESSQLIAYYTTHENRELDRKVFQDSLRQTLPEYMMPNLFIRIDRLPLLPSGKIDYSQLPAPEAVSFFEKNEYQPAASVLEKRIEGIWRDILHIEHIGVNGNFFALGGDSLKSAVLINRLQKGLGEIVFPAIIFDAPTIGELTAVLEKNYPVEVSNWLSKEEKKPDTINQAILSQERVRVDGLQLVKMRRSISRKNVSPIPENAFLSSLTHKNKPTVFILSAPRSGSTLLRVMLAGNSRLFSPPELALLTFQTLSERRNKLSGRDQGWREGVYRALMEIYHCDLDQAKTIMSHYEAQNLTIHQFYSELQSMIGERILVDKTTLYSLQRRVLVRAEKIFDNPKYIFLVRNPEDSIHSYIESHIDQVFGHGYPFTVREKAELIWIICNENIHNFLLGISPERQVRIYFEELVKDPMKTMQELSNFLHIEFEPGMLEPYLGSKMIDGVHPESRMVGDPRFFEHTTIDPKIIEKWKDKPLKEHISFLTKSLAKNLGYFSDKEEDTEAIPQGHNGLTQIHREWVDGKSQDFPLSYSQQRLWLIDQLQPNLPVYNIPIAINLTGPVNLIALERSINEIVRRHETFRTIFHQKRGMPIQSVFTSFVVSIPVVDLSHLLEDTREAVAMQMTKDEAKSPFNLGCLPLFRFKILRLQEEEHLILATFHHIIFDSWSAEILFREISQYYEYFIWGGETSGEQITLLPNLPIQMSDFAVWQRNWLNTGNLNSQLSFWKNQLNDANNDSGLPFDHPRTKNPSMLGGEFNFIIPPSILNELKVLSQEQNVTIFMTLFSLFNVLLYRYGNQDDLSIGIPIANRNHVEIEGLIGFFANTLILRSSIKPNEPFIDLLNSIRENTIKAYDNQDLPFDYLVEELHPNRGYINSPLFQVMFSLQPSPGEYHQISGIELSVIPIHSGTSKFDLTLVFSEEPNRLKGSIEYSKDLFESLTISRFVNHLLNLMENAILDRRQFISRINLLSENERLRLLGIDLNQRRLDSIRFLEFTTIIERFRGVAERNWEREAVKEGKRVERYGELEEASNRIGRWLRREGVREGELVVMRMRKGIEMIEWILGIMKAGCGYVPIDLSYPKERQRQILEDVREWMGEKGMKVITQEEERGGIEEGEWEVVEIEKVREEIEEERVGRERVEIKGSDLAYVIYTSGSTGRPKGVMVEHRNVESLMERTEGLYGFGGEDIWMMFHSYGFDFSVWEIWGALGYGGKLVIVGEEEAKDTERVYRKIVEEGVTVLNQTPSAFRGLMAEEERLERRGERGGMKVRVVIFGGEALEARSLKGWYERHGEEEVRLVNMYGITETTVHVTYRVMREADVKETEGSVIGRAIDGWYVNVLDENGEVVPPGVVGEIFVGGEGVVRGYLNRERETKERFIEDKNREGGRLYRSGDLGRWRGEGELEYMGRADQQVKIRGYRIELGEIEGAMLRHEGVMEGIAMVRERGGEKAIEGYVVMREGERRKGEEIKEWLRERLPEYMVPRKVVVVEKIPLTVNGKVDRKELEREGEEREGEEREREEKRVRGVEEEVIRGIWGEVLKGGEVGVRDNFFEMGGHSLLAAQMIARVREAFGVEIGLRSVFEKPTVEGMAERVREEREKEGKGYGKIERRRAGEKIPLSFGQERMWFLEKFQPGESVYHIPIVLRLKGEIDEKRLEKSLQEIVKRHEILRTRIVEEGGKAEQIVEGEEWVEERVKLRVEEWRGEEEEREEIKGEIERPFEMERGPMVRVKLIRKGEREGKLVIVMHHIVGDGWSMGVMVEEMGKMYRGEEMEGLEIQYGDYAVWQREKMIGEVMEEGLGWWKEELKGQRELEMPRDRKRSGVMGVKGGQVKIGVGEELLRGLKGIGKEEGATLFMVLKGILDVLLYRYSGEGDISVGTVVANRGEVGMEKLIGFFVNTIVMRMEVKGEEGYRSMLRREKEKALEVYAHGEVPFERIVSEIGVERDTSRTPLFDVMFILQNVPMGKLEMGGMGVEVEEVEVGKVPFELSVVMEERGGRLEGVIEYNEELYVKSTIERMVGHYLELMKEVVGGGGEGGVGKMRLLTEREEKQLLEEWNQTNHVIPEGVTLIDLFSIQAKNNPDHPAISYRENGVSRQITYSELDKESSRMANFLSYEGVKHHSIIGLCFEKSPLLYIGILAILKNHCGFLPLDPFFPKDRLEYMIHNSGVPVVLTQSNLKDRLPSNILKILLLDDVQSIKDYPKKEEGLVPGDPENIVYLMYTSGSTGKPKGVMVTHSSVINHNYAVKEMFELKPDDRILQFATINFDTSIEEIFPTWLSGATLVLPPKEKIINGSLLLTAPDLRALVEEERISILDLPTSFWHEWVYEMDLLSIDIPNSLRLVVIGGEKCRRDRFDTWDKLSHGKVRWINTYGPTEATIIATAYELDNGLRKGQDIPIGKPIFNVKTYILNNSHQPVPIGVQGELFIGGKGVTKGYINEPEYTEEKFVLNPFQPNGRMYSTGDWVKWLSDGNIEYIGRKDDQIKIRGFRVELTEIETVILTYPKILDAVVIYHNDNTADMKGRIIAFIITQNQELVKEEDIKNFLRTQLPDYMIPTSFIHLIEFPRFPNGKIDRQWLSGKIESHKEIDDELSIPEDEIEQKMMEICLEILGPVTINMEKSFFALGGDSILSLQLVAKAREKGLEVRVQDIFDSNSLRLLCSKVKQKKTIHAEQGIVIGEYGLTPIQKWFFDQRFENLNHWNQSLLIELNFRLDRDKLVETISLILKQHDVLRSEFWYQNDKWNAVLRPEIKHLPIVFVELGGEESDIEVKFREKVDLVQNGINYSNSQLLQFCYFSLPEPIKDRLLIVIHHLLIDVVSWRILLEDIWQIYNGLITTGLVNPIEKTTSYKEWSSKLNQYAYSSEIISEYDYWYNEIVEEIPFYLAGNPWAESTEENVTNERLIVDQNLTRQFIDVLQLKFNTTIQIGIISSLFISYMRVSGGEDLILEIESFGRDVGLDGVDVSRTIGWFTSLYPLKLKLRGKKTPAEIIIYIKEKMKSIPRQGIGYGLLRYLNEKTNKSLKKINIPISFNYLGIYYLEPVQGQNFEISSKYTGNNIGLKNHREYQLEINCGISDGQLSIDFNFNILTVHRDSMLRFIETFELVISEIIGEGLVLGSVNYSPSDFPLAGIDKAKLGKIIKKTLNQ